MDATQYTDMLGSGGSGGDKVASSRAEANVDYGTTDRSKNDPWPIVIVAALGTLGLVFVIAILFSGKGGR